MNRQERQERNAQICDMYLVGHTAKSIGEQFALTKEAVRQIACKAGIDSTHRIKPLSLAGMTRDKWRWAKRLGVKRLSCKGRRIYKAGEWPLTPAFTGPGGYLLVWAPNHPSAYGNGRVSQHRLVAEKYLGRYLLSGRGKECIHHIDGDVTNNEPANLCVFENMGYHTAFHRGAKVDESHVVWVIPEARERSIRLWDWPSVEYPIPGNCMVLVKDGEIVKPGRVLAQRGGMRSTPWGLALSPRYLQIVCDYHGWVERDARRIIVHPFRRTEPRVN